MTGRPANDSAPAAVAARRGTPGSGRLTQRLRLASGLTLFVYVLMHLLNHALGVVSIDWMEAVEPYRTAIWRSLPGTLLLYGALAVHVSLALARVARRRTIRMPVWEAVQLGLGLLIPFWLVNHVVGSRGLYEVFGIEDDYVHMLTLLWPGLVTFQTTLVLLVWVHGCIGIHFWLRLNGWYRAVAPWLLMAAMGVPLFATWGWIEAARRLELTGGRHSNLTPEAAVWSDGIIHGARLGYAVAALTALLVIPIIATLLNRGRGFRVTYPGGRVVRSLPGPTLLEISRLANIPHASVCGGRGRCSTCRTRILSGAASLELPGTTESRVLNRIGAAPDLRLACQLRPTADLEVRPLFPISDAEPIDLATESYRWGREQEVAILFVDIRGFTTFSEQRLPYDVVYLLNEYLGVMSGAVTRNGGYVDKFIGDAVMAIFGMSDGVEAGCGMALAAAGDMVSGLAELNRTFAEQLREPMRIGIGIHAGPAILGRVGVASDKRTDGLTALGDTVNTASRLETATKELGATLVFSDAVARASGVDLSETRACEITVRGRSEPLIVHAIDDPTVFSRASAESPRRRGRLGWRRASRAG
ncbi:adenylate/guanylate cyclase domain-containing protein [Amorphus sp. MBR-141]